MRSYSRKLRKLNFDAKRHIHFLNRYYRNVNESWNNKEEFFFLFSVTFPEVTCYIDELGVCTPNEVIIYLEKRLKNIKKHIRQLNIDMHKS